MIPWEKFSCGNIFPFETTYGGSVLLPTVRNVTVDLCRSAPVVPTEMLLTLLKSTIVLA